MKTKILLSLCLVLCLVRSSPVYCAPPLAGAAEPTVSPAEAAVLRAAQTLGVTNPAAAAASLRGAAGDAASAALDYALAGYEQRSGNLEAAVLALGVALKKMPAFAAAREALARLQAARGEWAAAAATCRLLLETPGTDRAASWQLLGQVRLQQQEAAAAVAAFQNALALAPELAESRLGLLQALVLLEDFAQAQPLLEQELARQPAAAELWLLLAKAKLNRGDQEGATANLETARRLGASRPEVLLPLGDLLLSQGLADEAFACYRQAASLASPPVEAILRAAGLLIEAGQHAKAAELNTLLSAGAHKLNPAQQAAAAALAARLEAAAGDPRKALDMYRRLLEQRPMDARLLLAAGNLLRRLDQPDEAILYYERARRADPDTAPDALLHQAEIAVDRDDYAQAALLLEQSLRLKPRDFVRDYLNQVRKLLP